MKLKVGDIIMFGDYCPKDMEHRRAEIIRQFEDGSFLLATEAGVVLKGRYPQAEMDAYEWEIVETAKGIHCETL